MAVKGEKVKHDVAPVTPPVQRVRMSLSVSAETWHFIRQQGFARGMSHGEVVDAVIEFVAEKVEVVKWR